MRMRIVRPSALPLTPEHIEKLNGDGLVLDVVMFDLGIGRYAAGELVRAAGAKRGWLGRWRLPNHERLVRNVRKINPFIKAEK